MLKMSAPPILSTTVAAQQPVAASNSLEARNVTPDATCTQLGALSNIFSRVLTILELWDPTPASHSEH